MNNNLNYNGELYHYGIKGMKWGVRRAQRREAIGKYRKEYNDMTKNDSRLTKTMNKLTGADKVYAVSKYTANKPTKTSGVGSAFAVSRKAAAAGRVAGMESKIANRNSGSKKTGFQRDVDSVKANVGARMKTVRDAKANNKSNIFTNKAAKVGAAIAITAVASYGAYKVSSISKHKTTGMSVAKTILNNKSYASMSVSEARDLRNKAAEYATKNGFKPTGNSQLDMISFMNHLI